MQDYGKLNDLAAAEIAALERDGIKLTPADIVQLNALGWAVETPSARLGLSRGIPVQVGGVTLWPLTLLASDWMDRIGGKFNEPMATFALAYAMAHGRNENGELNTDERNAEKAVRRWGRRLRCTAEELTEAIEQVIDQDSKHDLPPDHDGKPMEMGDFSAFLAATCGADPDFWERRCAVGYALQVLTHTIRQNAADGKPTANDPKIIAMRALGWAVEKIRNRETAVQDV